MGLTVVLVGGGGADIFRAILCAHTVSLWTKTWASILWAFPAGPHFPRSSTLQANYPPTRQPANKPLSLLCKPPHSLVLHPTLGSSERPNIHNLTLSISKMIHLQKPNRRRTLKTAKGIFCNQIIQQLNLNQRRRKTHHSFSLSAEFCWGRYLCVACTENYCIREKELESEGRFKHQEINVRIH